MSYMRLKYPLDLLCSCFLYEDIVMNVTLPSCADSGIDKLAETSHCPVVQILVLTNWQKRHIAQLPRFWY